MKFSNLFSFLFPFRNITDKTIKVTNSDILVDLQHCGPAPATNELGSTYYASNSDLNPAALEEINAIIVDVESGLSDKYHYSNAEALNQVSEFIRL